DSLAMLPSLAIARATPPDERLDSLAICPRVLPTALCFSFPLEWCAAWAVRPTPCPDVARGLRTAAEAHRSADDLSLVPAVPTYLRHGRQDSWSRWNPFPRNPPRAHLPFPRCAKGAGGKPCACCAVTDGDTSCGTCAGGEGRSGRRLAGWGSVPGPSGTDF